MCNYVMSVKSERTLSLYDYSMGMRGVNTPSVKIYGTSLIGEGSGIWNWERT